MQVLGVDGPRAHGQRLPHRAQGALARGQADLGAPPQGSHSGNYSIHSATIHALLRLLFQTRPDNTYCKAEVMLNVINIALASQHWMHSCILIHY